MLTAPAGAVLDDGLAAEIAGGLGAVAPVRLGPEAAEFPVAGAPDLAALRRAHPGIDVNLVPSARRRKRLLVADMDATIITVECINVIADHVGIGPEVRAITERAMQGELRFEDAVRARVALAEGLEESALQGIFDARIELSPGARTLVRTMSENGAHTALISGGFTWFSERVARMAGFAEHRANRFIFSEGRLTGVAEPVLGREAKTEALREMLDRFDLAPEDALAVGDGANDLGMVEAAGLGVGYRPKPALAAAADAVIARGDLTTLLYLQGYRAEEFIRD